MTSSRLLAEGPRDQDDSEVAFAHRRRMARVLVGGAAMLGLSFSSEPGSPRFYVLSLGAASTWLVGGLRSGRLNLGWARAGGEHRWRTVIAPVAAGVGAFGAFYGAALIARRLPVLNEAITSALGYASGGPEPLVLLTTLANGVAEEVYFRGALFDAVGDRHAVPVTTAVYMLATAATRNPALVIASGAMGTLFGMQRRASGGIQVPIVTHLTWSTLMLRYLPPLFRDQAAER
jgi:uncharacterized protein